MPPSSAMSICAFGLSWRQPRRDSGRGGETGGMDEIFDDIDRWRTAGQRVAVGSGGGHRRLRAA